MKKTIIWIIILALVIWGITSLGGDDAEEVVKIGFIGPLSGEAAFFGENAKAAVEIAVEEVNAEGGINGKTLEVIYEDDVCNGADAVNAVTKLVNVDGVSVILGSVCSPAVLGAAPVLEQNKIVGVAYCATAPKISEAGDYIFRNVPSDLFQAKFAADYIVNELELKTAAIVYVNNDWGVGLNGAFTEAFKDNGGTVVLVESYAPEASDMRAQLTKVKDADVDVIYFAGFPDGSRVGMKQIKEIGIDAVIFGADAWDNPGMWEDLAQDGEGAYYVAAKTNSTDDFRAAMKAKLGSDEIVYCSNYAYDGLHMLADIIAEVGIDSDDIKDALYEGSFTGAVSQPTLKFDENGDPKNAVYTLMQVYDGVAEIVE